ncbi:MAG: Na/Pi symporter [Firmicutes bacterium]|nr:Na/Pi symporter [Bacillota bacterium]
MLIGILSFIIGVGVFIFALKFLRDNLERLLSKKATTALGKLSKRRVSSFLVGAVATALFQSSTATTVITVQLVSLGVVSFFSATAIILGANIGTSLTAFLFSFASLPIALFMGSLVLVGIIGSFLPFKNKDLSQNIFGVLIGLGLLFVGLSTISSALNVEPIQNFFAGIFSTHNFFLVLLLFGALFATLISSSAAATGIVLMLASSGAITLSSALFIVLGTNIGTCIIPILSSFKTNDTAKRTAYVNLIFNFLGIVFAVPFLLFLSPQISSFLAFLSQRLEFQIAFFNLFFNIVTAVAMLPFINQFNAFVEKIIRVKNKNER